MRRKSSRFTYILLAICVLVRGALVLEADDEPKARAQVTNTERIDFPVEGVLRFNKSVGELTITGWDKPDVEITTIKTTRDAYGTQKREKAAQDLAQVQIKAERRGNDVVITTERPRHSIFHFLLPWRDGHADFDLDYRINAPHDARLVVKHETGEVHVEDLASDINISVSKGGISLHLPEDSQHAIDAKTDVGSIVSDFPGQTRRRWELVGYQFNGRPSTTAHNLYLRMGFGDIEIVKIRKPPYTLYDKSAGGPQP
jgi:hypothetical protein